MQVTSCSSRKSSWQRLIVWSEGRNSSNMMLRNSNVVLLTNCKLAPKVGATLGARLLLACFNVLFQQLKVNRLCATRLWNSNARTKTRNRTETGTGTTTQQALDLKAASDKMTTTATITHIFANSIDD